MLVNLLPYQILQPCVDAAFKKRGIDPEEFWRNAGLPAFRFPDPNGQRFANGAPPPAPTPLEGTPEHPGPAVPPGPPCSYTPPADGLPGPANPLPCADLTVGPFGDNPYGPNYGPARRRDVGAEPERPRPHAGCAEPPRSRADAAGRARHARRRSPPARPVRARCPRRARCPVSAPASRRGISPLPPALPVRRRRRDPARSCAGRPPPLPGNPPFLPPGSQGRGRAMSTIFNVRNLKLPNVSRASVIIGTLVVILALVAAFVGWNLYKKLTTNTVVAYFPQTLALYPGDKVQIMGVRSARSTRSSRPATR